MYTRLIRLTVVFQFSRQFHAMVSLGAITLGTAIYWLFRGIPVFHSSPLFAFSTTAPLVTFFIFSVPDGLWLYGLLSALKSVWSGQVTTSEKRWLCSVFSLSLCTEFAQYVHILPGTFDLLDFAAYLCAGGAFLYFNNHFRHANPQL